MRNGSDKSKAQLYGNVVNKPLLTGDADVLIRDIFNIPELHVYMGIVGKLVKEFKNKVFSCRGEGEDFMNSWQKSTSIRRCVYQGSASFEGNQA